MSLFGILGKPHLYFDMYRNATFVKYISSVFRLNSAALPVQESDEVVSEIKDIIRSSYLNETVTLLHPSTFNPPGGSIIDRVSNKSFLVRGVKLLTLCDLRFLSTWVVPKGLVVYNITGGNPVNVDFFIDSSAVLHLKLDPEVYKTLGLSNCTETHKNTDGTITLKISLKELSTINEPTKLYKRIQRSLSQISQATVIISSDKLYPINCDDLTVMLRGIGDDVTVEELVSTSKHVKVCLCC